MATLLAQKSGTTDNAIAKSDDHHDVLASDPTVSAFPSGSAFGSTTPATSTTAASTSTFGGSSSGFGSTTSTSSAGGFGSSSGFGSATSNSFGASTSATAGGFGASPGFGAASTGSTGFGASGGMSGGMQQSSFQSVQNQGESLKSGGGAMSEGGESTVKLDKDATDWINKKMRPMMGWIYMLTCTCDFVLFPILWSVLQAMTHGNVTSQWQPLTLQGAGLYHIAMGAVLGIAAYGRTKEKVAGVAS